MRSWYTALWAKQPAIMPNQNRANRPIPFIRILLLGDVLLMDLDFISNGLAIHYSSRRVVAGSIRAMRNAGKVAASRVTAASVPTTVSMLGASNTPTP